MLASITTYGDRYNGDIDGSLSLTMSRSARRGPWLPEEDQTLLQLVRTQGANNWVRISQQIQHRSPKQCRERYHQNLKPSLKHDPISAQEGEVIERLVQEMGKRWAEIARRLGNRSDNAVKNWWNGSVNRRRRNPAQTSTGFKQVGSRLQPVPFTLRPNQDYSQRNRSTFEHSEDLRTCSHETQSDTFRQYKPSAIQVPGPISTHPSSISTVSSSLSLDTRTTTSLQPIHTSRTPTAYPTLFPITIQTSDTRPELPNFRSASFQFPQKERLIPNADRPPISPALSDTSQRHAPSLISDSQSMYSISPGTVATPRTVIHTTADIARHDWTEAANENPQRSHKISYKHSQSMEPFSKHRTHESSDFYLTRPLHSAPGEDNSKDARMHVSTLLQ